MSDRSNIFRSSCVVLLSLLLVSGFGALFLHSNLQAANRGSGDGNIAGMVGGGGAGMLVEATATNVSGGPLKFTGLTLADGSFNITVDANPEFITPYLVEVSPNYHYDVRSSLYIFTRENDNETQHVPAGMLTASRVPTSNLTVTVLNGSSMEPLPGARFEVSYGGEVPEPPFGLVYLTDQYGNISIPDIRSGETSINLSKINFKYLKGSDLPETIDIIQGGYTNITLVLKENDWPFTTVPEGRTDDFTISSNITVNFGAIMDHGTIDISSAYKLKTVADGSFIPIVHEVSGDDRSVQIDPQVDLEYNTTYMFWMDSSVKMEIGTRPLWRPMEVFFTTELEPTTVSGYVKEIGTGQPVVGVTMTMNDLHALTDEVGMYGFPAVPPGDYTALVEGSYLHGPAYGVNITVAKGETIMMEDILVEPFPFGSLEVNVLSDLGPIEGAWVSIRGSPLNKTTNDTGSALFEKVREGMASIKVGGDHHFELEEERFIYEGGLSYLNLSLLERPFPVTVEPTDEIMPGVVDVSTDLLIHMPGTVQFTTLDVSLVSLNDNGTVDREVLLNQITQVDTSNTYRVDPIPLLELETSYMLIIGSDLRLVGEGENLLWRDMEYGFRTLDFLNAYINGSILLERTPYEGILISFGDFEIQCDDLGSFNMTVDMSSPEMMDTLVIDGEPLGYTSFSVDLTLIGEEVYQAGTISLVPLEGWYDMVPRDGRMDVDPATDVTFTFMHPILHPGVNVSWDTQIGLFIKGASAPVSGSYEISKDNRTLLFSPQYDLVEGGTYEIRVSSDLLIFDGRSLCPIGNITEFTVSFSGIHIAVLNPLVYTDVAIDQDFRLSFGVGVNETMIEEELSIDPEPTIVEYSWLSTSEVIIKMLLLPQVDYSMVLVPGTYGSSGEVLSLNFVLEFSTGIGYVRPHELSEVLFVPSPDHGWTAGKSVVLSGSAEGSVGYQVALVLIEGVTIISEGTTTVMADGSWSISLTLLPDLEGLYTLNISILIPGGAVAYSEERSVEISQPASSSGGDEGISILAIIAIIVIVVVVVLIVVALTVMRRQKEELDAEGIKYDEVDAEWSEKEE